MQIVIDIDENIYKSVKNKAYIYEEEVEDVALSIIGGTPLPKGHGDLIDQGELKKIIQENDPLNITGFIVSLCDIYSNANHRSRQGEKRMTREEAIAYGKRVIDLGLNDETQAFCKMAIKALDQEPLTDTEKRIFLGAMEREKKICREVDEKYPYKEPYEDSLVSVCRRIERKVKKALWE